MIWRLYRQQCHSPETMVPTSGDAVGHANEFALAANRQLLDDEEDELPSSDDDESTPPIPSRRPIHPTHAVLPLVHLMMH